MEPGTVQDRLRPSDAGAAAPAARPRKKVSLAINTSKQNSLNVAVSATPGAPVVTDAGSLRGDGISVSMAGLRINEGGAEGDKLALSEFKTVRVLGEGTSGVVKLVKHRPTNGPYAMKVIQLGCSEQERKQILIEVKTLHKSHVPGIITFFDAFYADNAVHIILEYMDCGSLAGVLKRHGSLPEPLLARVSGDMLGGLAHLHRVLKVVHRDIKPSNVLLNSRGEVKLADFGMSGQLASTFSRLASWVGTAAYMSPERISGAQYSYESDIWAFGVALWECAVGTYPYTKETAEGGASAGSAAAGGDGSASLLPEEQGQGLLFWDLLYLIVECPPPQLPPDLFSDAFCDLVHSCMHADGVARPSAEELLGHRWLSEAGASGASIAEWLKPDM